MIAAGDNTKVRMQTLMCGKAYGRSDKACEEKLEKTYDQNEKGLSPEQQKIFDNLTKLVMQSATWACMQKHQISFLQHSLTEKDITKFVSCTRDFIADKSEITFDYAHRTFSNAMEKIRALIDDAKK